MEALVNFRFGLYRCLTGWADATFELCEAVLCAPGRVAPVEALSLEPVFRRSHGSLYKALARGGVDPTAYGFNRKLTVRAVRLTSCGGAGALWNPQTSVLVGDG